MDRRGFLKGAAAGTAALAANPSAVAQQAEPARVAAARYQQPNAWPPKPTRPRLWTCRPPNAPARTS